MSNFTRITYGRKSSVPENAALLSFRHAFSLPEAAKKEAVRDALIGVFQKLIPSVSQNGIILGHLKGSIQAGGALLGSIFMATDYSTSPMTVKGGVIFAVGIGVITMLIRLWGAYPEGMSFAILIMNAVVPLINKYVKPARFGVK